MPAPALLSGHLGKGGSDDLYFCRTILRHAVGKQAAVRHHRERCLIAGLLLMSMGAMIIASNNYSYSMFALITTVLSLVLLSLDTTVLVVGSLRAS